jgi:hypothetical protein
MLGLQHHYFKLLQLLKNFLTKEQKYSGTTTTPKGPAEQKHSQTQWHYY